MQLNEVFLQSLLGKRYKRVKNESTKTNEKKYGRIMETGKKEEWDKEGTKQGWKGNGYILLKNCFLSKTCCFLSALNKRL